MKQISRGVKHPRHILGKLCRNGEGNIENPFVHCGAPLKETSLLPVSATVWASVASVPAGWVLTAPSAFLPPQAQRVANSANERKWRGISPPFGGPGPFGQPVSVPDAYIIRRYEQLSFFGAFSLREATRAPKTYFRLCKKLKRSAGRRSRLSCPADDMG